jgi:hypothetical protein
MQDNARNAGNVVQDWADKATRKADETGSEAKSKLSEAGDRTQGAAEDAKQKAGSTADTISDKVQASKAAARAGFPCAACFPCSCMLACHVASARLLLLAAAGTAACSPAAACLRACLGPPHSSRPCLICWMGWPQGATQDVGQAASDLKENVKDAAKDTYRAVKET